ncbi:MAG TPA: Gmad2 immunoglobulin-like domain-containing protein [Rubrobacteraceae bacterium]|nr:Gmad2 immunoglobulin-like domain-containing protein [Rubrobacteraceae bacterium]
MRRLTVLLAAVVLALCLAGSVPAGAASSADTLLGVRFGDHGTYERAVLDLGMGKSPAQFVPYYEWDRINGDTVVRIELPSVDSTMATGGKGLGLSISRYYTVRAMDGDHLFVDLLLKNNAGPVTVFYLNDPARIVVDVPVNGASSYPPAATGERAVVMRPRAGFSAGPGEVRVKGYARPFEGQGRWRIKNSAGKAVSEGSYRTTDWSTTWGRYRFTASYPDSLSGEEGVLQVGENSARDGSFQGVSVPLAFR